MGNRLGKLGLLAGLCLTSACSNALAGDRLPDRASSDAYYTVSMYELISSTDEYHNRNVIVLAVLPSLTSFLFAGSEDAFMKNIAASVHINDENATSVLQNHDLEICAGPYVEVMGTFKYGPKGDSGYLRELHDIRKITAIYSGGCGAGSNDFVCNKVVCYESE